MPDGIVKKVIVEKGFGFIIEEDTREEFFFHRSSVMAPDRFEQLQAGDPVSFEEDEDRGKGRRAKNVRVG